MESEQVTKLIEETDAALKAWRQGDYTLSQNWFIHAGDPTRGLTSAAMQASDPGLQSLTTEVNGLIVTSQTCDLVRSSRDRPFVELSPLVVVSDEELSEVVAKRRPRFATLAALRNLNLVVDLDRTMTVEKSILATFDRTGGPQSDSEVRAFALALARKRQRFAFPDDFVVWTSELQARFKDKHGKKLPEGNALRALREIRVRAADSWDAETVEVTFWFIREGEAETFEGRGWDGFKTEWLKLLAEHPRFGKPNGQVTTLAMLTAQDFVDSDPLELDHLSRSAV